MKEEIKSTYKSDDTEEWLDRVWTRPIGYAWALLFRRLRVHPNTVTVLSMIIGAASAFFFAHGSYRTEGWSGLGYNLVAILLLAWANFYDSADGQLARMTGQKTRLGRILDGAASEVWFIPIYLGLVYRFYTHHGLEFRWLGIADTPTNALLATAVLFCVVLYSGFGCHSRQCGLADYYRQIHLFFLKGEAGSELDNSARQRRIYDETPWRGNVLYRRAGGAHAAVPAADGGAAAALRGDRADPPRVPRPFPGGLVAIDEVDQYTDVQHAGDRALRRLPARLAVALFRVRDRGDGRSVRVHAAAARGFVRAAHCLIAGTGPLPRVRKTCRGSRERFPEWENPPRLAGAFPGMGKPAAARGNVSRDRKALFFVMNEMIRWG